jgi:hypothetical protein
VFTARYALSPYIKQIRFVFKGLMSVFLLYTARSHNAVSVKLGGPVFLIMAHVALFVILWCSVAICNWLVPWLRQLIAVLSPRRPTFSARPVRVGFVVDKVTSGQVFLVVLQLYSVSIIPPILRTQWFSYHRRHRLLSKCSTWECC